MVFPELRRDSRITRGNSGRLLCWPRARGSAGEYQADEWGDIGWTTWRLSVRSVGRCREAQLASIIQMSGQVSRGSAGEYQADEQAGVTRLSWRVSG